YGSGLRKFHLFCNIFSVPESARLPASFQLLHSFVLWAVTDPDPSEPVFADGTPFEPVSAQVARKYLAAIRAWHIAQGWPPPLTPADHDRINWSLHGLQNIEASRRTRPPRPPVTLAMLRSLKDSLNLKDPFDACIWAMASCAFFGLMRFGEVSVTTRAAFDGNHHAKRCDVQFSTNLRDQPYARIWLPSAKTANPGEGQAVLVNEQDDVCPIYSLRNLAAVVPARAHDPLFSWRDSRGDVRPMVKQRALERINRIFIANGWGTTFGHSFRIGGASFFLAKGVDPEIVRLAGCWKSLAYQTYIRAF
ncbi:hypothetical protein OE88DRAFT_1616024, partial [Heliocybe sulcata]